MHPYMKKFFVFLIAVPVAIWMLFSCSKSFLDRPPYGVLDTTLVSTQRGLEALLIGAYSMLDGYQATGGVPGWANAPAISGWESAASNWVYGSIAGGDAHKGSDASDQPDITPIEKFTALPTNNYFNQKWRTVYEGISRANVVLKLIPGSPDLTDAAKTRITGEARFLRAFYHFEAKKMWNMVPFIDENIVSFSLPNPNIYVKNDKDIWPEIQADLDFAYTNLPETQAEIGRANKWSAGAMLGKCLVYQKKWAEAKTVLDNVVNNGKNPKGVKYALLSLFQDNFNAEKDNGAESVFAVQSSVNDGSGASNGNYPDALNMPYNNNPFTCCGFFQPSQDLVNSFKTNASGLPDMDNYNTNPVTIDNGQGSFTPYAGTLDPRLDWTVGRRTIPYLDWTTHKGTAWQRDASYSGPYSPKKNLTRRTQQGEYTDASFWNSPSGVTALNVNLIRFADVLLLLAEAEAELSNLPGALQLVNQIRTRADNPNGRVFKFVNDADPTQGFSTTPAANYSIGTYPAFASKEFALKAIHFERKLELAMEGHRFFDLVRWGEAAATLNKYFTYEGTLRGYLTGANFVGSRHEYFPIPQRQIDLSKGTLTQNPY